VTNLLFWNFHVKGKIQHPESILARTALTHDADLIMLAECRLKPASILEELNAEGPEFYYPEIQHERFVIFTRFPGSHFEPFEDHPRLTVRRLCLPGRIEILVGIIHFPDKRNHSLSEQRSLCFELAQFLRDAEARAGHRRTILVGDFNMNPFEEGMVDVNGFGATMTKDLARRLEKSEPNSRPRFYNPMWGHFGDLTGGPPGTFYHPQNSRTNIYWHLPDQVLVRTGLIDAFIGPSLRVLYKGLSRSGDVDFLRQGRKHWKVAVSDHLPILFTMDLPKDATYEQPT
jgi:Endonuclease/Exonuclease/phosphatase family